MKLTEKEIQKLIISNETSLNEMIQKIISNNHKILLVNKIDKLIGYITPLMLKIELQSFGLDYDTNAEKIIAQYEDIIPDKNFSIKQLNEEYKILSKNDKIEVSIDKDSSLEVNHNIKNALVFCGGKGLRLGNLTNELPKPLLEINKKPILHRLIDKLIDEGFNKVVLATSFKHHIIESYFYDLDLNIDIEYLYEETPLGTAGSIIRFFNENEDENLICLNGDVMVFDNLNEICNFHFNKTNIATFGYTNYKIQFPYGVVNEKDFKIDEKPLLSKKILSGVNVFNRGILNITNSTPVDMNILYENLISESKKVSIFPFGDDWLDIGNKKDLTIADKYMKIIEG